MLYFDVSPHRQAETVPTVSVEIVFETHSTTVDNELGVATGWLDGELSERGKAQAVELGERRRDDGLAAVFSSDLGRAVQTVNTALGGCAIPLRVDPRLREINYGEWNGMPVSKLEAERPRRISEPFPRGESYRDVVTRMAAFLAELSQESDGSRVLVVGHSATRLALDHLLNHLPLEQLVSAPSGWQAGWPYVLPSDWRHQVGSS